MHFEVVIHALPFLLKGFAITLLVSLLGTLLGVVVGVAICALRSLPGLAVLAALYISYFRGVPLLVQLLVFYNFLPYAGIDLAPITAAVCALGMVGGAYVAELLRGALAAIPTGQVEAGVALGFSWPAIGRRLLLPQVLRLATPAMTNELILLVKASSLVSVVGLAEVTRVSQTFAASTLRPMEFYLAAGAFYLITNLCLAYAGGRLERHLARR
ncbi:ABC transporter permease subunit [Pseudomonas sp. NPDC007930]|uniref:amino acid ABC transporter permease n=1 Tax=Pseudomonas sp. NPDC007930 TaxID=3364417 RepID=UPI0036EA454A